MLSIPQFLLLKVLLDLPSLAITSFPSNHFNPSKNDALHPLQALDPIMG